MTEEKTAALVLGVIKYGDHGNVVRLFTPHFGMRAFMVNSLRSKKGGQFRPSMTLPLTAVEVVMNPRVKGSLFRFTEVRPLHHWKTLHSDPIKMTLCTFGAEVVSKLIAEEHPEIALFNGVLEWLKELDEEDSAMATAPQRLLLLAAQHMGCSPHFETYEEGRLFDMIDGKFVDSHPSHNHWMDVDESKAMHDIAMGRGKSTRAIRQQLLEDLLGYLRIHHEPFGTMKSLELIRVLLS
ncbi:MAG: hypothetical protein EP346_06050 [Bacteroidetes bacterium]|nr:MAG: hypothetical protein EP346_06050 [Bacteroidota bacterium]